MNLRSSIQLLFKFPPHVIAAKVVNKLKRGYKDRTHKKKVTSGDHRIPKDSLRIHSLISIPETPLPDGLNLITEQYLQHRFNLLGSGWVSNRYDSTVLGLEDIKYNLNLHIPAYDENGEWLKLVVLPHHLGFSKHVWSLIREIHPDYQPIDWQKDFKCGFRWSAQHWFKGQRKLMDGFKGADLKVPWELSRLQHLPQLALYASKHPEQKNPVIKDFVAQTLDFIMANPIGMGVNFNCPMDIGIRNANVLVALDLFKQIDADNLISEEIETVICHYMAESTVHILEDMEYREGLTSNHYLGNVLGILFTAAYLNGHSQTSRWLAFGIQEIIRAMDRQFFDDGGNFEGSTSYHRLSGEMMVWGAGIILALNQEQLDSLRSYTPGNWPYEAPLYRPDKQEFNPSKYILPERFWEKLMTSIRFAEIISKDNGNAPQFGDNDSGRFIKLTPLGESMTVAEACQRYMNLSAPYASHHHGDLYWDENDLNQGGFISAGLGLINTLPANKCHIAQAEHAIFSGISQKHQGLEGHLTNLYRKNKYRKTLPQVEHSQALEFHKQHRFDFDNEGEGINLREDVSAYFFENFQLVVLKGKQLYLALNGTSNAGQHHSFGHVHNDKLSIEFMTGNTEVVTDPGTYLYTPIPERRELFRSTMSHNTISVDGKEQNTPLPGKAGLFNMKHETVFRLTELSPFAVLAEVRYRDVIHRRRITIETNTVTIDDWCNKAFTQHWNLGNNRIYSNGYGKRLA